MYIFVVELVYNMISFISEQVNMTVISRNKTANKLSK